MPLANLPKAILLTGPTGSGKSPLGDHLAEVGLGGIKCRHFDFGEALRNAAAGNLRGLDFSGSEQGFIRDLLERGALLENEQFHLAERILGNFISCSGVDRGRLIVLNGLPRHVGQAGRVGTILDVTRLLVLEALPDTVAERIRLNSGGDRVGRDDDASEKVAAKLRIYAERTEPLVEHYRQLGARIDRVRVEVSTSPEDIVAFLGG